MESLISNLNMMKHYLSLDMLQKGLKSVDIEQNVNKNNGTDGVWSRKFKNDTKKVLFCTG